MNSKPDDRSDNAQKIKENIESTKQNIELAEKMIASTSDKKMKRELQEKNERREKAIPSMIREMKEEEARKELGDE